VWAHLVGFQPAGLTLWQLKQAVLPVGMWVVGFAVAVLPSWQLTQFVDAVNVLWSTLAPAQVVVLWQVSQFVTPLCTGVAGLPTALWNVPVWQLAQLPVTATLLWNLPLVQVVKPPLWQVSHDWLAAVGTWLADLPVALPAPWQLLQVPATTPV
jgi:hypothetical protein